MAGYNHVMDKKSERLVRFGVSMETSLLKDFDHLIGRKAYTNRSEAIRDYVREDLSREGWQKGREATAVLAFIYDHHQPKLLNKLSHLEHEHSPLILSNQHVHLDHFHCLEVLTLRGKPAVLQSFSDKVRAFKGVQRTTLSVVQSSQK
jgi:CopG family transcriptional regulator, nickel-responsive regulator